MKKYIIKISFAIVFVLLSTIAFSQNISIESFRWLDRTVLTGDNVVKDINGETCAVVIINTTEQGFEFSSCNIEKTEQKIGEIWLFVSPGSKFLTIQHRELGTIRNYQFPQRLEPKNVYEIKLKTAKITQIVEESITNQYLIINSKAPEAKIFINNEYIGRNSVRKLLPIAQTHSYKVEAPLYHSKSGNVKLNPEEKTTLQIDLDPAFGYLKVNTTPESGAEIEINSKLQSQTTPFTSQELESGKYIVQAFKPMYKSLPQEVDIRDGQTTEITITLIPTFATANITCQDKEAEIYIDGEFKAKGSFKGQLSEGIHQLDIKKQSHRTIKRTINAISGQTISENIEKLQAINGKLNIDSQPFDADIYIDGKHYGKTPNIIPQILIGEHQVTLKKDGFKDLKENIKIEEGKLAEYNFTLQEKPKIELKDFEKNIFETQKYEYKANTKPKINWLTWMKMGAGCSNDKETIGLNFGLQTICKPKILGGLGFFAGAELLWASSGPNLNEDYVESYLNKTILKDVVYDDLDLDISTAEGITFYPITLGLNYDFNGFYVECGTGLYIWKRPDAHFIVSDIDYNVYSDDLSFSTKASLSWNISIGYDFNGFYTGMPFFFEFSYYDIPIQYSDVILFRFGFGF